MCGIFGYYGEVFRNGFNNTDSEKFFTAAAIAMQFRGTDATGYFAAGHNNQDKLMTRLEKTAMSATDTLLQAKIKMGGIQPGVVPEVLLGHVRAATIGGKDNHDFAHPHYIAGEKKNDNIRFAMTHNGTLHNWRKWVSHYGKDDLSSNSDSAAFCTNMWNKGVQEAVEDADGAFAIVAYDTTKSRLYIARNHERPLYLYKMEKGVLWTSDPVYTQFALAKARLTLADETQKWDMLPTGSLHLYSADKEAGLTETKEKFTVYSRGWVQTYSKHTSPRGVSIPAHDDISNSEAWEEYSRTVRKPNVSHITNSQTRNFPVAIIEKQSKIKLPKVAEEVSVSPFQIRNFNRVNNKDEWLNEADFEDIASISAVANGQRNADGIRVATTSMACYAMINTARVLTLGDIFQNNAYLLSQNVNGVTAEDKRISAWFKEPVLFELYSVPSDVAVGFMKDTNARMEVKLQELFNDRRVSLVRNNSEWTMHQGWSVVDKVSTLTEKGEVLLAPANSLTTPYICVPEPTKIPVPSVQLTDKHFIPYCRNAMSFTGHSMLWYEYTKEGEVRTGLPSDNWNLLELDTDYKNAFPVNTIV